MFGKHSKVNVAIMMAFASCVFAENYNWGNIRFDGGGFVSAVLPSPAVEGLIYARTDVGGVYRWDAKNNRWIPLMDWVSQNDVGLLGTEAIALDPTDPKKVYVLGGTGYFSDGRTAVLRSSDFGDTWDTSYVEFGAHGNGMGRQTGEKLAVDPNKPSIVLCGSRSKGLFKSTDSGKTWANLYKVATSDATGSSLNNVNGVAFVLFDASNKLADGSTGTIYIGTSETKDNFQVSKDGGATWKPISGGPSGLMPHRVKMVGSDMYITFTDGPGPWSITRGAFYKYNTASGAWTDLTPMDDEGKGKVTFPFGGVAIDPKDSKHIVISTICHYGERYLYKDGKDNWGDKIYVSTDGGATWKHGQDGETVNVDEQDNKWIHGNAIHWAGSVEFDPFNSKKVWVTSGNGVFQTDDITAEHPIWKFQSRGIEETVPLDIVSVPGGPLVTAIGDYDGAAYTDITKSTERHMPNMGTTQSLGYAPLSKSFVRTGVVTEYLQYESINHNLMYRSDDNGATWTEVKTTVKGPQGLLVLSADGKVILHRPDMSSKTYRSDDNGASWTDVTLDGGQTQNSRIVADPVNPKVFYVMDAQAYLYRSEDAGKTFAKFGERLSNEGAGEYYNGGGLIRTVPAKEGHLWVPMDQAQVWLPKGFSENGLAYTEDGGKSWIRCKGANTAIAVGIGKAKEGSDYETIFIWGAAKDGDPIGIYRSTDKCATFERVNDNAHQYGGPGNGNFVQGDMNNFGVVYMSTVGRGVVVGAPEGTKFVEVTETTTPEVDPSKIITPSTSDPAESTDPENIVIQKFAKASVKLMNREMQVTVPTTGKVELVGANGKVVFAADVFATTSVNLRKVPAGRYIARVMNANGKVLTSKLVNVK